MSRCWQGCKKGNTYRTNSFFFFSPKAKNLETLLLPSTRAIYPATLDAISTHINRGLNQNKSCHRIMFVALNLSKTFYAVNHATLFTDVERTNKKSKPRRIKQAVPQGRVISPKLFNLYLSLQNLLGCYQGSQTIHMMNEPPPPRLVMKYINI